MSIVITALALATAQSAPATQQPMDHSQHQQQAPKQEGRDCCCKGEMSGGKMDCCEKCRDSSGTKQGGGDGHQGHRGH